MKCIYNFLSQVMTDFYKLHNICGDDLFAAVCGMIEKLGRFYSVSFATEVDKISIIENLYDTLSTKATKNLNEALIVVEKVKS